MALRAREHRGAIVVGRCAGACASDTCAPPSPSVRRCAAPGASAPRREGCCAGTVCLLRARPARARLLAHQGDRTRARAEGSGVGVEPPAPRGPGASSTWIDRLSKDDPRDPRPGRQQRLLALAGRDRVEHSLADRSRATEHHRDRRWPGLVSLHREPLRPHHRPGARPKAHRPGARLERLRRADKNPHDERCPVAAASAMPAGSIEQVHGPRKVREVDRSARRTGHGARGTGHGAAWSPLSGPSPPRRCPARPGPTSSWCAEDTNAFCFPISYFARKKGL